MFGYCLYAGFDLTTVCVCVCVCVCVSEREREREREREVAFDVLSILFLQLLLLLPQDAQHHQAALVCQGRR